MKLPKIKAPLFVNVIITIVAGFISWFTLLFGIAHLIGGHEVNRNISRSEELLGIAMVTLLCVLGVTFLILTIASINGIIDKVKKDI